MRTLKTFFAALCIVVATQVNAQSADEIISTYYENIGGVENWEKVEGIKIHAVVNQQGMEIPVEIIQLKDGRQASIVTFQGKEIKQAVFDGETLWSTNFMTQKAEKSDAEATANMKLEMNDFPDSFLNYKKKGYTAEFMGKEDLNGTEVYKIKLVKEPVTVDGKEEESVSYFFFDAENYVPLSMESEIKTGQAKGQISEITFSDYQEVDGLYFPFSMTQGLKDQPTAPISVKSIEINPVVEDSVFAFPKEEANPEGNKN